MSCHRLPIGQLQAGDLTCTLIHPAAMFASPVHHPKPATGKQFDEIVQRMQRLAPKDTPITVADDHLVVAADCPR